MKWVIGIVAAAAAIAAAQAPLSPEAARKALFGVDMTGVLTSDGASWRECVQPDGRTSYWFRGAFKEGQARVREDGAICFAYADDGYATEGCYRAFPEAGGQFRFVGDDPEIDGVWLTTSVKRGVQRCDAGEAAIS